MICRSVLYNCTIMVIQRQCDAWARVVINGRSVHKCVKLPMRSPDTSSYVDARYSCMNIILAQYIMLCICSVRTSQWILPACITQRWVDSICPGHHSPLTQLYGPRHGTPLRQPQRWNVIPSWCLVCRGRRPLWLRVLSWSRWRLITSALHVAYRHFHVHSWWDVLHVPCPTPHTCCILTKLYVILPLRWVTSFNVTMKYFSIYNT